MIQLPDIIYHQKCVNTPLTLINSCCSNSCKVEISWSSTEAYKWDTGSAGKPDECHHSFEQVFTKWKHLNTSPYTWKSMINTLRTQVVGEVK